MATGNQWKHLEFTLALSKHFFSVKLENIRIRTSRKHKANPPLHVHVTQKQCRCHALWQISVFYFQNKVVYRAEDRPTDICLKMTFT